MLHAMSDHGPCGGFRGFEDVRWAFSTAEPKLDEMLADPMVRLVMRRDHLDPAEVRRFMVETAEGLKSGRPGPTLPPSPHFG